MKNQNLNHLFLWAITDGGFKNIIKKGGCINEMLVGENKI